MADKDIEQIKYETELLRLTALFVLAIGGSSIGLLLGERTTIRLCFALSGIGVSIALIVGLWKQHWTIRNLIAKIKEASS